MSEVIQDGLNAFFFRDIRLVAFDLLDILAVAGVIYFLLRLMWGTRGMQMLVGMVGILGAYAVASYLGMATLSTLLRSLLGSIVVIVVVIFQNDIRRALARFGGRTTWWQALTSGVKPANSYQLSVVEDVIGAVARLAKDGAGALIVFARGAALEDFVAEGVLIDARVSEHLVYWLFRPSKQNHLHDGAMVLRDGRLWRAGVFLPMTTQSGLDVALGTRHRAAIGLSDVTDAVVVVVSEERRSISVCFQGNIIRDLDVDSLRGLLPTLILPPDRGASRNRWLAFVGALTGLFKRSEGGAVQDYAGKPGNSEPGGSVGKEAPLSRSGGEDA